jgi:hypothetical protein
LTMTREQQKWIALAALVALTALAVWRLLF